MSSSDSPGNLPDKSGKSVDWSRIMVRDRFRLRGQLRSIERMKQGDERTKKLNAWQQRLDESVAIVETRSASVPTLELDETLPIAARGEEIASTIRENRVTIIAGETGSGKSTQLPLIALQAGFGRTGMIGHTQPRRIAARSVAARIAQQLGQPLGQSVGYQVRFHDQTGPMSLVKVMTDGILLAETQTDRFLDRYDLLIIDEAHERSLNVDFVIAWLRQLIERRDDLHVVITSATLDTARFAEHFALDGKPAPVIEVEGRTWPVDIRYEPLSEEAGEVSDPGQAIVHSCAELLRENLGDILVFLPTEREIRTVAKQLRGSGNAALSRTEILPLYGRLADNQQAEIFRPHSRSRIVLATNVAESSITVPGIRSVVDLGTARISRYAPRSKVQRLPIEAVSQASAKQRAGRCGRLGPGVCVRLYRQDDFTSRPEHTTPEIRRTNLAGTLLKLADLGVGDIERFPLIDPPTPEAVRDGYRTLFEIGATDEHRKLNKTGKQLARLPVDPRIGRVILAASDNGCLSEMLIIASSIETQDVRVRPAEKQQAADQAHQQFADPAGDFMSILKLWDFIHKLKTDLSRSRFQKALEQNFLSPGLVHEWLEVHRQLLSMSKDHKLRTGQRKNSADAIHRSLLTGFLSGVARLDTANEYVGAGNSRFNLWPGSSLFSSKPKWILAGEVVETTRRFGRTIGPVNPDWIESIADHVVKRNHIDPYWSDKNGTAMVYENVLLFGLPIVNRRRTGLAAIDPDTCRDLFIQHGLVENQIRFEFPFHRHNLETMELISDMATRLRDRQSIVHESQLEDFYQQRLPSDAVDVRSLRELLAKEPALDASLRITPAELNVDDQRIDAAANMPTRIQLGSLDIPVEYRFEPGDQADGVSIQVPLPAVGQLEQSHLLAFVPGLARERVIALIRSLPKNVRRLLVPAPDVADRVLKTMKANDLQFTNKLAGELSRVAGEPVTPEMFDWTKVDPHLLVNVQVIDDHGAVLAQGRWLSEINQQLGPLRSHTTVVESSGEWHQDGVRSWDWDEFPRSISLSRGQLAIEAFPTIVDEEDSVSIRLYDSAAASELATRRGLVRLLQIANRKTVNSQVAWLPNFEMLKIRFSRWVPASKMESEIRDLLVRAGLVEKCELPTTRAEYEKLLSRSVEGISIATQEVAIWFPKLVEAAESAFCQLESTPSRYGESVSDVKQQLARILHEKFVSQTPWIWLQHFPRYLNAIRVRLEKLPTAPLRADGDKWREILEFEQRLDAVSEEQKIQGWIDPELVKFRWMIEEFRVSQFAQQLGTSLPISKKRLEKQLQLLRRV